MRICLVSRYNLGRNTRVLRQAKALSESGHQVTVVSLHRPIDELIRTTPGVEYVEVAATPWTTRALLKLRRLRAMRGAPGRPLAWARRLGWFAVFPLWLLVAIPSAFLLRAPDESTGERLREFLADPVRPLELYLQALAQHGTTVRFAAQACAALRGRSFDYVQAHDSYALLAARRLARQSGAKLVYDAVEIAEHRQTHVDSRTPFEELVFRYERAREARLIRKASLVLTIGDRLADWHAERYGIARPIPVRNARYFVEHRPDDEIRRDSGLRDEDRLVVWLGNIDPVQGLDALVEAAALLPESVHFAVVGGVFPAYQEFVDSLKETISETGLTGRFHFLEQRDPNDLIRYVSGGDIGVIPRRPVSLNVEYCLPNKVMEMIMARLPLGANRGLVEVSALVEDFGIGETFDVESPPDLARAIGSMLDSRRLPRYREAVMRAAEDLCWENEVQKYLALFEAPEGALDDAEHARRALAAERETSARRARQAEELRGRIRALTERQAVVKASYDEGVGRLRTALDTAAARRREDLQRAQARALELKDALERQRQVSERAQERALALQGAIEQQREFTQRGQARALELREALLRQKEISERAQARALELKDALERVAERLAAAEAALEKTRRTEGDGTAPGTMEPLRESPGG